MKKPTIQDLATRSGLSPATVDRVLHERPGVSVSARRKVREAIHELGFGRLPTRLAAEAKPHLHLVFLMPSLKTGFVTNLERAIYGAALAERALDIAVEIRSISLSFEDIVEALENVDPTNCDGVGLFAADTPIVREAINHVSDLGVPVVTLVSDCPKSRHLGHVGIDNTSAGRTVGRLMGRFLGAASGKIGVITGTIALRDHMERYFGFRQVLSRDYRHLHILPFVETHSIAARNREAVIDLLSDHPDVVGLYSIAAGNSGILAGLRDCDGPKKPVVIAHELTNATRRGLLGGDFAAVVGQDPDALATRAIRLLTSGHLNDGQDIPIAEIGAGIYLAENLPERMNYS